MLRRTLVWLPFLVGEARHRQDVAIPRPVFIAAPGRRSTDPHATPNPGMGQLRAWFFRVNGGEPTHAEVTLADGTVRTFSIAWIHSANRVVPLRRTAPEAAKDRRQA